MSKNEKLDLLKDILLTDERESVYSLKEKIKQLEAVINEKEELSKKIDPILDDKLSNFVKEIPNTLGPTITKALNTEIKNSQNAVVEALYPIMGKMIKKYIQNEMRLLLDNINASINNTFSLKNIKLKLKAKLKGVSEAELILKTQLQPTIDQVMVIEKDSGLLISKYSKTKNIDEDVVAGMLTAIKSFVEDAFNTNEQDLQYIEYDTYHLHIQNFSSYYIAVAISGPYNQYFKSKLEDKLLDFAQNTITKADIKNKKALSKLLKPYFETETFFTD